MEHLMTRARTWCLRAALAAGVLAPAAAWAADPPATAAGLDCNAPPAAIAPSDLKLKIVVDRATLSQPRSGEILFTIEGNNVSLDGLTIKTCMGWRQGNGAAAYVASSPVRVVSFHPAAIKLGTTVPNLPDAGTRWPDRIWSAFWSNEAGTAGMTQMLWTVPVANLRILGVGGPVATTAPLDVVVPIGVTSVSFALIATLAATLLAIAALHRIASDSGVKASSVILKLVATRKGAASLSQLQILLWTLVIAGSAIYVMILSGDLINITTGTLVLLGITGVAAVGSKVKSLQDDAQGKQPSTAPAAAASPASPPVQPPTAAPPAVAPPPVTPPPTASSSPDVPRQPLWTDLVADENGGATISMPRVQMLFFTFVLALFVAAKVVSSSTIPEIPEGFLLLMGISNGLYLSNKFTTSS